MDVEWTLYHGATQLYTVILAVCSTFITVGCTKSVVAQEKYEDWGLQYRKLDLKYHEAETKKVGTVKRF